jgi:hypothetical protein
MVTVWVDSAAPPVGRVGSSAEAAVAFAGWLDLLAHLSALLDGPTDPEQETPT